MFKRSALIGAFEFNQITSILYSRLLLFRNIKLCIPELKKDFSGFVSIDVMWSRMATANFTKKEYNYGHQIVFADVQAIRWSSSCSMPHF